MQSGEPVPPPERRHDDFRAARVGAVAVLCALLFVLGVQDTLSLDYTLEPPTLITIVVAICGLVGVELKDVWRNRP